MTQKKERFFGLGDMTRGQLLSVLVLLSGGGYGVTALQGHAETVSSLEVRVSAVEKEYSEVHTSLAVIQSQGERSRQDLEALERDLKELTRAIDHQGYAARPSRLPERFSPDP